MAKNRFKKPDGSKDQGEKTTQEKGPATGAADKGGKGKGKGAEKAARRYGPKEVKKGG